jgi:hypothetical protein
MSWTVRKSLSVKGQDPVLRLEKLRSCGDHPLSSARPCHLPMDLTWREGNSEQEALPVTSAREAYLSFPQCRLPLELASALKLQHPLKSVVCQVPYSWSSQTLANTSENSCQLCGGPCQKNPGKLKPGRYIASMREKEPTTPEACLEENFPDARRTSCCPLATDEDLQQLRVPEFKEHGCSSALELVEVVWSGGGRFGSATGCTRCASPRSKS